MPSDSIAGFLDQAKANRVLFPDQVEQLIRQPDIPQSNLDALCEYLEHRGALTRFQADMIRQGRGYDLTFAGVPGHRRDRPVPGRDRVPGPAPVPADPGRAPPAPAPTPCSRPTPRPPWSTGPGRPPAAPPPEPHPLLDAGTFRDEPYAVRRRPGRRRHPRNPGPRHRADAGVPGRRVRPAGRRRRSGLRHERGLWHGDVRPATRLVGPMTDARPGRTARPGGGRPRTRRSSCPSSGSSRSGRPRW